MRRAFVLAGGTGTRLAPYTTVLPKPLMPLGRSTILERLVTGLVTSGLADVTVSLGYLGHLVEAVLGDGSQFAATITYTRESQPLGTAGALALMPDLADDDLVLVVNGDTLTDIDFSAMLDQLDRSGADALIACVTRVTRIDYGVVTTTPDGLLDEYSEKPEISTLVSTGINGIRGRAIRAHLGEGRQDMPDFLRAIQQAGGRVACLRSDAFWADLGRPDDLARANEMLADG